MHSSLSPPRKRARADPAAARRAAAQRIIGAWRRHYVRDARRVATFVLDAARRVYATLGWGWHEDVYREALGAEILLAAAAEGRAVQVQKEVAHPVLYRGRALSHVSLRMDMVVGARVVLELKATNGLPHGARRAARQCARYLAHAAAAGGAALGLVINFVDKADQPLQWEVVVR